MKKRTLIQAAAAKRAVIHTAVIAAGKVAWVVQLYFDWWRSAVCAHGKGAAIDATIEEGREQFRK